MELSKSFTTLAPRVGVFSCFLPSWPRRGLGTEWVFTDYRKTGRKEKRRLLPPKELRRWLAEGHSGESGACEKCISPFLCIIPQVFRPRHSWGFVIPTTRLGRHPAQNLMLIGWVFPWV